MTDEHLIWDTIRKAATKSDGEVRVHYDGRLIAGTFAYQALADYDAALAELRSLRGVVQAVEEDRDEWRTIAVAMCAAWQTAALAQRPDGERDDKPTFPCPRNCEGVICGQESRGDWFPGYEVTHARCPVHGYFKVDERMRAALAAAAERSPDAPQPEGPS